MIYIFTNAIWTEKYRPSTFDEVIGLPTEIPHLVGKSLPHILLTGPAGTGKTTIAKIIIKEMKAEFLLLNASDERGVETVRDKVKSFSSTTSMNGQIKIVFLDEADGLTRDAQQILRNLMETYHRHCRFILTANYSNKIIDPLKSRCSWFELKKPTREQIFERLKFISEQEKLNMGDDYTDNLTAMIDRFYPDIRSCIKNLQIYSIKGELNLGFSEEKHIYQLLKKKEFTTIRKTIMTEGIDLIDLIGVFEEQIMNDPELNASQKTELIIELAEVDKVINFVPIPRIVVEAFFLKAMRVMSK